jgi:hypothetical protein
MKRTLISLLVALTLLMSVVPVTAAATQYGDCTLAQFNADTNGKTIVYENSVGDTSDNDDRMYQCGSAKDYGTWLHGLPGTCHNGNITGGGSTWNDCISSVKVFVPSGKVACFYPDANYPHDFAGRPVLSAYFVGPRDGSLRYNVHSDYISSYRQVSGNASNDC